MLMDMEIFVKVNDILFAVCYDKSRKIRKKFRLILLHRRDLDESCG